LFEGEEPVDITDYLTMLLFDDAEPALVVVRGGEIEVFGHCGRRDVGVTWLAEPPSAVAFQFGMFALRDTIGRRPDISNVCVSKVTSCESTPRCGTLEDEFVVSSMRPCTKGAHRSTVFSYYEWSGEDWRTVTGTATDDIRCRLALQLAN
jgi:hypothetical protein